MRIKATPEDFRVEELTDFSLSDAPDRFRVFRLTKRRRNTLDVALDFLACATRLKDGKAAVKRAIAQRAPLDAASLPYDPRVIDYLRRCKAEGRRIGLFTAADQSIADAVAAHLGPDFPSGIFVCQDGDNTEPGSSGRQNFKLVRLDVLLDAGAGPQ